MIMKTITIQNGSLKNFLILKFKITGIILVTALTFCACQKTKVADNLVPEGMTAVEISISASIFEESGAISNRADVNNNIIAPTVLKNTISFNDDFYLLAELTPQTIAVNNTLTKPITQLNKAASVTIDLKPYIKYKIIAYDQNGNYVTEKDYIHGSEASAGPLMLDGGKTYSFVAYSINSTSSLPSIIFTNPANKTLATSNVNISGSNDFMYFRKDLTVSGTTTNYLNVVLKHQLSQITTIIDATQAEYKITSINSIFKQHNSTATINLASANISRTGTVGNATVAFNTLNQLVATSAPTIINANSNNNTSYTINSITIGPLTQNNITPFNNLNIIPGVKYDLKLTIIPIDDYIIYKGQSAARINGQIWMRHNVGANYGINPDLLPITSALHGNYYQWGRKISVGNGTSTTVSNWNGNNNPPNTAWDLNNGIENTPIKTVEDPCPTNYRIPTTEEYQLLLDNTTNGSSNNVGTWNESNTNFSSAKVLISKRKSSVKLILPAQGWYSAFGTQNYPFTSTPMEYRGIYGFYWTSSIKDIRPGALTFASDYIETGLLDSYNSNKVLSGNIRCIAQFTTQ